MKPSKHKISIFAVMLFVFITSCYGKNIKLIYFEEINWINSYLSLSINNNGQIYIKQYYHFVGDDILEKSIKLSKLEIKEFEKLINDVGVFNLPEKIDDKYTDIHISEASNISMTFIINGKTKEISFTTNQKIPVQLQKVLQYIQTIKQKIE